MMKYRLLFPVTLGLAFVCGATVRSGSPTTVVPTVSDAHLNPLDKLHREIARRREVSSLQRDSVRTTTPKVEANDRPPAHSNTQPSNVVPIAEDISVRVKGTPVPPAAVTLRLRKKKDCVLHRCRRNAQITKTSPLTHDLFRQSGGGAP